MNMKVNGEKVFDMPGMKRCEHDECPIWIHGYCTALESIVDMVCQHKEEK